MMKWFALTGAVLVVLGGVGIASVHDRGIGIGAGQNPWHLTVNLPNFAPMKTYNLNKTEAVSADAVKSLQIDADTAVVQIHPGTGKDVTAHLYGRAASNKPLRDLTFTVVKTGDTVRITLKRQQSLDFAFGTNLQINLDVTVPQKVYDSLTVQTATGEVDASNLTVKRMNFHLATGALNIEQIRGNVTGTTSTGAITITNVAGSLNLTANTGKIAVHDAALTHNITAKTNTGEVTIEADTPPKNLQFNLSTSIGSVNADVPNATVNGGRTSVSGTVGSGGPVITGHSDVGAVSLNAH